MPPQSGTAGICPCGRHAMTTDNKFSGSIPEFYDTYLVPLIFKPYSEDMALRVAAINPNALLELAAGSGATALASQPTPPTPSQT